MSSELLHLDNHVRPRVDEAKQAALDWLPKAVTETFTTKTETIEYFGKIRVGYHRFNWKNEERSYHETEEQHHVTQTRTA